MIRSESNLRPGERVLLFPSYAKRVEKSGLWRILVRGVVYDPNEIKLRKRMLVRVLRRVLSSDIDDDLDSEIFNKRIETFAAATERGKRICIRLGARSVMLRGKSGRNGSFSGSIRLSPAELDSLRSTGDVQAERLQIEVCDLPDGQPPVRGRVHLITDEGLSVVSDIDDTIKHTNVTSRRELLANTFLREFRCVSGMDETYRQLAAKGALFHYVSSSPWQLYTPLAELCDRHGFPVGTFHLRNFRFRDHMLRRFRVHRGGKAAEIRQLIEAFPRRRFVLIGDSGERDPEIYSRLARDYPEQVRAVFIRDLADCPVSGQRHRRRSRQLSRRWFETFDGADDLAGLCREL